MWQRLSWVLPNKVELPIETPCTLIKIMKRFGSYKNYDTIHSQSMIHR